MAKLTIERQGDTILPRPVRPNWRSYMDEPHANEDFLRERSDVIEEGRFSLRWGKDLGNNRALIGEKATSNRNYLSSEILRSHSHDLSQELKVTFSKKHARTTRRIRPDGYEETATPKRAATNRQPSPAAATTRSRRSLERGRVIRCWPSTQAAS